MPGRAYPYYPSIRERGIASTKILSLILFSKIIIYTSPPVLASPYIHKMEWISIPCSKMQILPYIVLRTRGAIPIVFTYNVLSQLSKRVIGIYVDDFGPGYAAFNNLKSFLVKSLKIARLFVRDLASDPSDRSIAKAVVAMAHRLNPIAIAEGIETPAQWQ